MKIVAGIDIGNATTETALARIDGNRTAAQYPQQVSREPGRTSMASSIP